MMIKNKMFWYGNMTFAVLGWVFFFYGLVFTLESQTWKTLWWVVVLLWGIGHPLEMMFSLPIGKKAGLSLERTIVKTMIFGIMWWIPLKLNVFDE
jgi:hypothetical protein